MKEKDIDYGKLKWVKVIYKKQKDYEIKSDSEKLAYCIMLWDKYAPKPEDLNIDIMYETIIGGYEEYSEDEKNIIKEEAIKIMDKKYKIKLEDR